MTPPLSGLHMLDLSTFISGPMAVALLTELGIDAAQVARWVADGVLHLP